MGPLLALAVVLAQFAPQPVEMRRGPGPLPDLVVEAQASPSDDGREVSVSGVVRNVGQAEAPEGELAVQSKLGQPDPLPSFPAMKAGGSTPFIFRLSSGERLQAGKYDIVVTARPSDEQEIQEGDTTNNAATARVDIPPDSRSRQAPDNLMDLAIADARRPDRARPLRVQATVENRGDARAPDAVLTVTSKFGTGSASVRALGPHERSALVVEPDTRGRAPSGWHTLKLAVSPQTPTKELDVGNNTRSLSVILVSGNAVPWWTIAVALAAVGALVLASALRRPRHTRVPRVQVRLVAGSERHARADLRGRPRPSFEVTLRLRRQYERGREVDHADG